MYVYTDQARDMGNVGDVQEMIAHFEFLLPELMRVLMPGRTVAIHLTQALTFKRDGEEIGIRDFRGATIDAMRRAGFTHYGEVLIDKNPQLKAIRTKDRGLLFKSLATDAANMHMCLGDYLIQFRKPGENPAPIRAGISEKYDNEDGYQIVKRAAADLRDPEQHEDEDQDRRGRRARARSVPGPPPTGHATRGCGR
jgi:hypothetical protein